MLPGNRSVLVYCVALTCRLCVCEREEETEREGESVCVSTQCLHILCMTNDIMHKQQFIRPSTDLRMQSESFSIFL